MRVVHIRLRAITGAHTFGVDVPLGVGLNIIRGDNTSGKSTCLLAILYCLGLERALGPSLQVPLPYAMRQQIQVSREGDEYERVLQSYVMLEVANDRGDVVCVRRDIEGGRDRKLVQTWPDCTVDTCGAGAPQRDYFLHDPGSAVRADGFHAYLANFLDLDLPSVPRFDGSDCPLYLEAFWPLFFVEQKRGWSSTQGPFPTFLKIQDLPRRVMEFVLALDIGKARRLYAELSREVRYLEQRWKDKRSDLVKKGRTIIRVVGLPPTPTAEFAHDPEVIMSAYFEDQWISVDDLASKMQERRDALEAVEPRDVEAAETEIQVQLREREERNTELSAQNSLLQQEYQFAMTEKDTLDRRIATLEVDLRRNLDAQKLEQMGSNSLGVVTEKMCPTCHQPMAKELLPEEGVVVMAVEENIAFARSQLDMYRAMKKTTEDALNELGARFESMRQALSEIRRSIRALKRDLVRPANALIWSEVEELVRLEERLGRWMEIQEEIDGSVDELQGVAKDWTNRKTELEGIRMEMSSIDRDKIKMLVDSMQEYLQLFGFQSFSPKEIGLAEVDFRPQVVVRDGGGERLEQNIGFEASASDGIRLKWAYYLALLQLRRKSSTNHVGMVIFDEPGQHQMREVDLATFLSRAAEDTKEIGQIVISTSESVDRVRRSLRGKTVTIHDYDGFILRPIR